MMFRLSLPLLLAVGTALAQNNCPTCGQNPPLLSTTLPPQTATAQIRIVLNAPSTSNNGNIQVQAAPALAPVTYSPCASGNCNTQNVQAAPVITSSCSSGNCNNVVAAPVTSAPIVVASNGCSSGNCNNIAPIVVRAPSSGCSSGNCNNAPIIVQAPSNNCFGNGCGPRPIVIPAFNPPCSGIGCGAAPIILPSPIVRSYAPIISPIMRPSFGFGCGVNGCRGGRRFGNVAIPDPITTNGRYFRPRVRVPTRYDNGNPVFTLNNGFGRK